MTDAVVKVPDKPLLAERLMNIDIELHSIINELKVKKHKKLSLSELNKIMEEDRILDVDSTKLVREMRDKEYKL